MASKRTGNMKAIDKQKPDQPAWKDHQQKQTQPKDSDDRDQEKQNAKQEGVKVKLLTNYSDIGKTGDTVVFDEAKAKQLVDLKRAEYVNPVKPTGEKKASDWETGKEQGKDE